MIFVTVGEQTPFDRLIRSVDEWARNRDQRDLVAQIGRGDYVPQNMEWSRRLPPEVFAKHVGQAQVVVAHAGMGTILTCLQMGAPLLVLPRRAHLRETRNDHQVATARRLGARGLVDVAGDEQELLRRLDHLEEVAAKPPIAPSAPPELVKALRDFII